MRFQLFRCEITRADRQVTGYLVAPESQRASEIVIANEIELNRENLGFTLERVDEVLPDEKQQGLEALLECAPAGFVSFCPGVGWIPHCLPAPKLNLYRIEEADGNEHFIVAPTGDVAAAVFCHCVNWDTREARLFRIRDGAIGLRNVELRGLTAILEFGPVGMVAWDNKDGWQSV